MSCPFQVDHSVFAKNWAMFLVWGIVLTLLGFFAISASSFFTLMSVVLIGVLLLISGLVIIIDTFTFWWRRWTGFFLHLVMGLLYAILGGLLIKSPVESAMSLTYFLGIFFIIIGVIRAVNSFFLRSPRWGWGLINGLVSLLLGIMILSNWPASSLYIIGLFVGIDLVFCGITYIAAAMASRSQAVK